MRVGCADNRNWRDCRVIVIDTETTGTDPFVDRVVQVGAQDWLEQEPAFVELVDPECEIPPAATAIHGISRHHVKLKPNFYCFAGPKLKEFVGEGAIPAGYNWRFDRAMLGAAYLRSPISVPEWLHTGYPYIDILVWVRHIDRFVGGSGRHKLSTSATRWGIMPETAHDALGDARTAARLLKVIAARMPESIGDLMNEQRLLAAEQEYDFQKWLSKQPPKEHT